MSRPGRAARFVRWVGRIPPRALARVCAWHGEPMSECDARLVRRGAQVTSTMCESCRDRWLKDARIH